MRARGFWILILLTGLIAFIAGCSQNDVYEHAMEYKEMTENRLKEVSEGVETKAGQLPETEEIMKAGTRYLSDASKKVGIYIIVGSVIIGVLLLIICSRTHAIRLYKAAWLVFLIGIPVIVAVGIYGLAFLASWFL